MAVTTVQIHGRPYEIACDDGQEDQLVGLAQEIDDHVCMLARSMPHAKESMLLVLTSLTFADEMREMRRRLRDTQHALSRLEKSQENGESGDRDTHDQMLFEAEARMEALEMNVANALSRVTDRLLALSDKLAKVK